MHLFLSPHPDDVVLSCGGLIQYLLYQGETVVVLTLMAQDAPLSIMDYPYIQRLHERWNIGDMPFKTRRAEDQAALQHLGVTDIRFGGWHDAIYRTDADGDFLYSDDDHLFGTIDKRDALATASIPWKAEQTPQHVYAPLGAGNHVDHQVVRNAAVRFASQTATLWFYEEYPYSAETAEVLHAHAGAQQRLYGSMAVAAARKQIDVALRPTTVGMTAQMLEHKLAAIACYRSQMSSFWESTAQMKQSVRGYASVVADNTDHDYAERLWVNQQLSAHQMEIQPL